MTETLLQQLQEYEGRWVALFGTGASFDVEDLEIVAVGNDAAEASERAAEKGYKEATLFKVPPSDAVYAPHA